MLATRRHPAPPGADRLSSFFRTCRRAPHRPGLTDPYATGPQRRLGSTVPKTGPRSGRTACSVPATRPPGNASRSPACGASGSTARGRAVGAVVRRAAAGRRRDGGAGQLQRHRCRRGGARLLRRRLVPDHGAGAARLGRASAIVLHFESATHRATVWVERRRGRLATRAATPRSRPTSPTTSRPGERGADHRRGQQHADLPVHPAGRHRGHPGRQAAALLARLLQLRRHPPHGLALRHRPDARRPTSRSSPTSTAPTAWSTTRSKRERRRRRSRSRVVLRDADGAEVATGDRARAAR